MNTYHPYTIFPLGDGALTIEFGDSIHESINARVLEFFEMMQDRKLPFVLGLVPAYASLTVFYETSMVYELKENGQTAFSFVAEVIERFTASYHPLVVPEREVVRIPVCYATAFSPDLDFVATQKGLTIDELVQIHTSQNYRVYMLGFLPGFPYMGITDERISITRKPVPRPEVQAGSVGLAGRQTGIYPLNSPGGWQIIGRTPFDLFDKNRAHPVLLKAGDAVEFYSITEDEYTDIKGRYS